MTNTVGPGGERAYRYRIFKVTPRVQLLSGRGAFELLVLLVQNVARLVTAWSTLHLGQDSRRRCKYVRALFFIVWAWTSVQ